MKNPYTDHLLAAKWQEGFGVGQAEIARLRDLLVEIDRLTGVFKRSVEPGGTGEAATMRQIADVAFKGRITP